MSTILVNNIKSYTGTTVTISGSHILVQGQTTLGDGSGTDTLKVRANSSLSGSVEVSGSITPSADNTYDLGSAALQWNVAHLTTASVAHIQSKAGGTVVVSGSLNPLNDDKHDLGSVTREWKDVYSDGVAHLSQISASSLPTSTTSANSGELYTLSGSQIFSSSAWTSGHILSGATSASLFVFLKA